MQVIIKSKQMQVTAQLRQWIEHKVQRLTRLIPESARVEVTVAEEQTRCANDRFSVQLALSGNAHPVRSEVSAQTASAALDLALDKVVVQLGRQKEKLTRARKHHVTPIKILSLSRSGVLSAAEQGILEAEKEVSVAQEVSEANNEEIWRRVLEIRQLPTTPMTDQEVIEEMEKSGNQFYPFYNEETSSVNVMYRLEAGGYGLLVPATVG